ncbi:epidermal growth factor receptor substrate 15-like 1 isoform X1 [Penaeus chinensis]|uniref:epidermal growth factor receptor substrate 15-like 1 isoform X1 n=1 Tax=Penaeus chinensis TaxID=139456 RepID=UPI001FB6C57E|nr:epidermal growth factor receptor substrate 15-like 1 isoform X1 [Penaeus chinensis]
MASLPSPTQVAGDHTSVFEAWYKKVDPSGSGVIQAGPAAGFLKKSGLNDNILSRIWDISDPGGKGYLDKAGMFVSLKMVSLVQNGKEPSLANINLPTPPPNMGEPPPHPPPPVKPAPPHHTPAAAPGVWTITPTDRMRYDQIFNSLGPEANKLHGNKVRGVMLNSKLPMETLGKIWDLSDMDKDGSLDRVEFSIAMHLVYKVLENNPMPSGIPQEMLSSAQRAGVAQGPVPAPLAPPSQLQQADANKQQLKIFTTEIEDIDGKPAEKQPSGPPPAPWVISAAEKARYDVMFHNADLDKDGFVSGNEIKGVFLQSGLPQMVLAHIWNLCDMKQTGKLTSEQFALAMWLIQQKLNGTDPPAALTPEMVPPTMRPKPSTESNVVPAKPQYSNPELQLVADEIEELNADKLKLEAEIQQKEASIRVKNNELKNLQTELDTLTSTLRQLEHQKGAAQQRLDDLGNQKKLLEDERKEVTALIEAEQEEVSKLRAQVEEQETSLKAQEDEVMSKRQELNDLKNQESELEESVTSLRKKMDQLGVTQQETQLHISQAKIKISELQDQERHMTEVLIAYDSAISSGDASSLSEASLRDITPTFNDSSYLHIGPSPTESPKDSPKEPTTPQENGLPSQETNKDALKAKDTSFSGGHDPFAAAFGGQQNSVDMFASWDHNPSQPANNPPPAADPFGGDAFAAQTKAAKDPFGNEPFSAGGGGGPPPRPESPTPALPPKKSKQPPPRPAPPKTRPAKPPPPQINSNNNPTTNTTPNNPNAANNANSNTGNVDPFAGGWGDNKTPANATNNGGFADFANFADFDTKCSKVVVASNPAATSPWGDEDKFTSDAKYPPSTDEDPFGSPFTATKANIRSTDNSPWPQDAFGSSGFGSDEGFGDNSVFADDDPFSKASGAADPFGGDYDPFKDQGFKDADKFSWEDEPDPFNTIPEESSESAVKMPLDNAPKTDPFGFSMSEDDTNANLPTEFFSVDQFNANFDNNKDKLETSQNTRSKSVIGDPFASQVKESIPVRSKTSLGERRLADFDFDPFSSSKVSNAEKSKWKSNEDLLNENFGLNRNEGGWGSNNLVPTSKTSSPFNNSFLNQSQQSASEEEQLAWAAKESIKFEEFRKQQEEQERADLELALTLSRSMTAGKSQTSRSPSTGL